MPFRKRTFAASWLRIDALRYLRQESLDARLAAVPGSVLGCHLKGPGPEWNYYWARHQVSVFLSGSGLSRATQRYVVRISRKPLPDRKSGIGIRRSLLEARVFVTLELTQDNKAPHKWNVK